MKRSILALLLFAFAVAAFAQRVTVDGVKYRLLKGDTVFAEAMECVNKDMQEVEIPQFVSVNGMEYEVESIGEAAFTNCRNLASVVLPESVSYIGERAFANCTNLVSINIPDHVTEIASYAFMNCEQLATITIPASVETIGGWTFCSCASLIITVPRSVKEIGAETFWGCKQVIRR